MRSTLHAFTGHPKGVAIGTRNLLANVMAMTHSSALTADYPPPGSNIIMVSPTDFSHLLGP